MPGAVVTLVDIDEDVLARMVTAATTRAAANEVTPPLDDGTEWTPGRVDWLRGLHRDRRSGLDGASREGTWAIVVRGDVVGAVRLRRRDDAGELETGIWLTRDVRGRGVATVAVEAVLDLARDAGARRVHADTTAANVAAQAVLRRCGFTLEPADGSGDVRAVRVLDPPASTQRRRQLMVAMKVELVPLPVSDVDRAVEFYVERLGCTKDVDVRPADGIRIVQVTPPGSHCSLGFGTGLDVYRGEPGSVRGVHLVVEDLDAARDELVGRGIAVGEIHDFGGGVRGADFADPDGNSFELQEMAWRNGADY